MEGNVLKIEYLPIESLKPYEKNARKHEESDIETIVESIREFGFDDPIGIWGKENLIVEGHGRLMAAKELGMKSVPVIRLDHLTDEQRRAYALAHNKTAEMSTWDFSLLELELAEIDIDMSLFGFNEEETDEDKKKKDSKRIVQQMQIRQFEHHDYIVFVFDNQMDWLNAVSNFGIEKVDAGYGKTKKIGIGRVLDGKRLLEKVGYTNSNTEPWAVDFDIDD